MGKPNNVEAIVKDYRDTPSVLKSQLFGFYSEQGYRAEDASRYAEEICTKVRGEQARGLKAKKLKASLTS